MKTWTGGCHCGDVRFEVDADLDEERILDCNCSMCTKKALLHLIVPQARFRMLTPASALSTYTFGTHVAKHTFCKRCGIHAFYTPRSHPDSVDVNVRCLDGIELAKLHIDPFNGAQWEDAVDGIR